MPSRPAVAMTLAVIVLAVIAPAACAAESFRFTRRAAEVGDQTTQNVAFGLKVSMLMQQDGQVIDQADRDLHRKQNRIMTALEINDGLVTKTMVRYGVSEVDNLLVGLHPAELVVTDAQGNVPPPDQLAIVRASMVAVGRTNPWTNFLAGRTLTQGQAVQMPNHLAAVLFGAGGAVGDVSRFEVTLSETRQVRGATCAVLDTKIEAKSPLGSGVDMLVSGTFLVEIDTCRTLAIDLSGDVAVSETHGPVGGQFTVEGKGTMRVAIEAEFGSAPGRTTRR